MNNRLRVDKNSTITPITIDDIAEILGVSKTTVSRAISGKGRISVETREKVLCCIEEYGYTPNHSAKSLAVSKSFNVAVVVPTDATVNEIPFFHACLNSISGVVEKSDYDVLFINKTKNNISSLKRIVNNQKVDGVILTRLYEDDKDVYFLQKSAIPFLVIGSSKDQEILQVDSDQEQACRELTMHVLEAGEKNILLLAGDPSHQVNQDRFKGFCAAMDSEKGYGIEPVVYWSIESSKDIQSVFNKKDMRLFDCVLCMDDVICTKALKIIEKNNIKIPDELRIASFYDSIFLENYTPSISAIHIEIEELGEKAGELILDAIEGKNLDKIHRLGWDLRIRDSTRNI